MPLMMTQSQAIPVIFIPGLLADGALFTHQIKALEARGHPCQVIVPDFADNMFNLASGAIERIPYDQFALAGLSMGGYVAFEVLRQLSGDASRVAKVVLMNTQARADTDEHKNRRRALIELSRTGRFKGVTPRLLPNLINRNHLDNTAITDVIFDMAERSGRTVFEAQQMAIMNRQDSRPLLPTITQPALLIGGVDDTIAPPDAMTEMAAAMLNATLHMLPDCGHLSPLEQAEKVTDLLVGFLS
jgi:pimeloyl-ACP methyl ester carboxylesterase